MEAVMSASHGVLGPLVGKLTSLLADECVRLKGVRREIRSLRSEMISMQAAVQKYSNIQDPDVQVKAWISLVRDLAYDTEDAIDKFVHQLGNDSHSHGGFKDFFRKTARRLKTLGSRRGIANQIDELKLRVKEVKDLKSSYKLDDIAGSTFEHSGVDPRLSALFVEEEHLVGIDGPRDDLVSWLVEEENCSTKHRKVLSIVGFGGLGKTTLAREVYRKIQGHFHCWAFVSISQKPNVKRIMKEVISQVPCKEEFTKDIDIWDEKKCIVRLRELLQDKRYLVVIDDIWSISVWDTIKYAFPENNLSSRIIATTRIVDVARSCSPHVNDRFYEMEALCNLHSKSISSLLANRPVVKDEWERVRRSIGSALDKNRSLEGMNNILSLSYNDLPPNLKTCLLYLSIFPEDYVIDREILVRRWIAEGFISEERGQSKQEVAENYFYELINKSMVQPVAVGYDGKARACQVHDMMLELIISKSVEDNFIAFVGHGQTDLAIRHGLIRRLSIHYVDQELASVLANEDLGHVRSLTVIGSSCIKHLSSLVKFEVLRVLDFQGCESLQEYDMNDIDKLFQLKYLSLRGTDMSKLPSGIMRLNGLETLDLRDTYMQELPSEIVQLIKLQHLLLSVSIFSQTEGRTKIPNGIGNMKNLRVISGFNVIKSSFSAVEELGNLTALEELHIQLDGQGFQEYKRHEEMLLSSLCKLGRCKLQSLWIRGAYSTPLQCQKITEEDLCILGEMRALLSLKLWFLGAQNDRLIFRCHVFPCLKEFGVYSTRATYLKFEKAALPKLEKLKVPFFVSAAKANGFNLGINHLSCLKHVEIDLYNEDVTSSESKAAAAAIRNEANAHPNHPRVSIFGEMEEDESDEEELVKEISTDEEDV
ncbi:unnamed protein product [Urochloa decumbens]|uniref:Uncharacterized protein n=1 Tax=Urochloa decumbens TaxID=240449 RepID=A0ABC8Z1V8_9POAL